MKLRAILVLGLVSHSIAYDYFHQGADWADPNAPDYDSGCVGRFQSPIDIHREEAIYYDGSELLEFSATYCHVIEGYMTDNNHTLIFNTADGLPVEDAYITGGPLYDKKYHFLQFHLHWGSNDSYGSEHLVDGQRNYGELHLVHVNEDYIQEDGSIDATAFTVPNGLSVLGIMLEGGKDNQTYDTSWFDFAAQAAIDIAYERNDTFEYDSSVLYGNGNGTFETIFSINLNQIVHRINPTFFGEEFNYWHYDGGLTTPGCSQAVQWIVAERALPVSDYQLEQLMCLNDQYGYGIINNWREEQDFNCRKLSYVYYNEETRYTFDPDCPGERNGNNLDHQFTVINKLPDYSDVDGGLSISDEDDSIEIEDIKLPHWYSPKIHVHQYNEPVNVDLQEDIAWFHSNHHSLHRP